jgi:hypothetical protein
LFDRIVSDQAGSAERLDNLTADGLATRKIFCNAFGYMSLSIKERVNGRALKATIDSLPKLCAVSVRVKLAFVTDGKNHAGTAGLARDNTGLLCQSAQRESRKEQ